MVTVEMTWSVRMGLEEQYYKFMITATGLKAEAENRDGLATHTSVKGRQTSSDMTCGKGAGQRTHGKGSSRWMPGPCIYLDAA